MIQSLLFAMCLTGLQSPAPTPEVAPAPAPVEGQAEAGETPATDLEVPAPRTEAEWRLREMELLARIRSLELELAQEQALRLAREQEWLEFTGLLNAVPAERRPQVPAFLEKALIPDPEPAEPAQPDPEELAALKRAQEIKTTLRAFLRAEGWTSIDLLEVGSVQPGGVGPIVARQLDGSGHFLSTLVADRLRLEKSTAGYTLTLVFESGYERRAGQVWPFADPDDPEAPLSLPASVLQEEGPAVRRGALRIALTGVRPDPWLDALPELFRPEDLELRVNDGRHDPMRLKLDWNQLLKDRHQADAGAWWPWGRGG
ncbi:MAG: hypothetical protein R3F17_00500 [Planctomycetota bacterium]